VVHRDIKPENVLVTEIGTDREVAKVLDFGIAKLINQESLGLTGGGAIGTPAYMSPEQGLGQKGTIDARSDIYSVGCLLYELLTGLTPFESESLLGFFVQHGTQPVPPMAERNPAVSVPEPVEQLVRRALEKSPEDRFESAEAMIDAIDQLGVARPRSSRRYQVSSPPRVRPLAESAVPLPAPTPAPALPARSAPSLTSPAAPGATAPTAVFVRARLDRPAAPGECSTLFVFGGTELRFGRSKPGQRAGKKDNSLILRVLPCPDSQIDMAQARERTRLISSSHGLIDVAGEAVQRTDTSSYGTWLDGSRVGGGVPVALPESFRMGVSQVLDLEGRVLFAPEGAPAGLLLRRCENRAHEAYLWVFGPVQLTPDLELASGFSGWLRPDGSGCVEACLDPTGASVREVGLGAEV
jgi:hypothetical protein